MQSTAQWILHYKSGELRNKELQMQVYKSKMFFALLNIEIQVHGASFATKCLFYSTHQYNPSK